MKFRILFVAAVFCSSTKAEEQEMGNGRGAEEKIFNRTFFVSEIFRKYGNREYMTYEGFEHLLESLGLGRLKFDVNHDVSMHKVNGTFKEFHDELKLHKHNHELFHNVVKRNPNESKRQRRCLTPQDLLATYGLETNHGVVISRKGFVDMCPAIIYELDRKSCTAHTEVEASDDVGYHTVWLYASLSILFMSTAGLLSILLVPVVTQGCYKRLLEFLIAAGVGTLCGDALLHLLPHVLVHRVEEESKLQPILRGIVTLLSIFIFFAIELLLKFIQNQGLFLAHFVVSNLPELWNVFPLKSFFTYLEDACSEKLGNPVSKILKSTTGDELGRIMTTDESRRKMDDAHYHSHDRHHTNDTVASMVIIGDILHNVTDGLSIGAAFTSSTSSGIASSIAIFAHELPHELGDYAALISSGMSKKQTILYNIVSSIFSFVGMVMGILLGEIQHASLWINAFTAGSFLYISLADLVPEMKLCLARESKVKNVVIHMSGLICGGFIMLCVALFEDDLKTLIN